MGRKRAALEATPPCGKVQPPKHQNHAPEPLTLLNPKRIDMTVHAIRHAVQANRHAGGASYLFIADADADGLHRVFVISELRSVAKEWVREKFRWLVAFYAPRRGDGSNRNDDGTPFLQASIKGVTEDVLAHLADLARAR